MKLVLGVGNPILTDDAVGLRVAERVRERLAEAGSSGGSVEVRESHRGGLDLVDLMSGCTEAVVVDAFTIADEAPGTVLVRDLADFGRTNHLFGAHGVDLPTAIDMGRILGAEMPERVHIVGVVAADACSLGERMTPAVEAAVDQAVEAVLRLVGAGRDRSGTG